MDKDLKFMLYFDDPEPEPDPEEESGVIVSTDLEPGISIDHISRITRNINTLTKAMGITNMIPLRNGNVVKIYKYTVTLGDEQENEGDLVPLSHVKRELDRTIELSLVPRTKVTSGQAIQRVGRQLAINDTDAEVLNAIQSGITQQFFDVLEDGTGETAGGTTLQEACAQLWGALSAYYEDKDFTPVFFINPTDVATYLGTATLTTQTLFGMRYLEGFLGMGNAFISARIDAGTVYATAQENLNAAYMPANDGDVADTFGLTADESGLVGMTHRVAGDRFSVATDYVSGVAVYPEVLDGIFSATIGD